MWLTSGIWLYNAKFGQRIQNHLFFWESEADLETFQKFSSHIWVIYKLVLESVKNLNPIFEVMEYWWKVQKCIICEKGRQIIKVSKIFLSIFEFPENFFLKSVKSLNRIFWATEYWFKALKCQIWLTNTKPFFWESEANLETLQKLSLYIWVSYKFVLKFVKSLNRIFWAMEYLFKALKCQIVLANKKPFFWKREANFEILPKFSPYI